MKSIYYNGEEKAVYTDENLKWLNKTDAGIFEPIFENHAGIIQEETDEGNVIFLKRDISTPEKIAILLDVGFSLEKGTETKSTTTTSGGEGVTDSPLVPVNSDKKKKVILTPLEKVMADYVKEIDKRTKELSKE